MCFFFHLKCAEDVIAEQAKKDEDDPFANLSKKEKKKKKKMVRVCLCLKVFYPNNHQN